MKLKKNLSLAILAATALLLPLASPAHDDDDDEREHRHRYKKERRKQVYYYHYHRPQEPVAAYRAPPPPPPVANPQPGFPRESSAERQSSKGRQREILEAELATELQLLARARQDGKGDVDTHANNVDAIKRELRNLAR